MAGIVVIFFLNDRKLSSHLAHINEHINSSNHNIHTYYQISNIIVNLCSKRGKNNNNSTCRLSSSQKLLIMSIFNTPEDYLPNVDQKSDMRKVRTS